MKPLKRLCYRLRPFNLSLGVFVALIGLSVVSAARERRIPNCWTTTSDGVVVGHFSLRFELTTLSEAQVDVIKQELSKSYLQTSWFQQGRALWLDLVASSEVSDSPMTESQLRSQATRTLQRVLERSPTTSIFCADDGAIED